MLNQNSLSRAALELLQLIAADGGWMYVQQAQVVAMGELLDSGFIVVRDMPNQLYSYHARVTPTGEQALSACVAIIPILRDEATTVDNPQKSYHFGWISRSGKTRTSGRSYSDVQDARRAAETHREQTHTSGHYIVGRAISGFVF